MRRQAESSICAARPVAEIVAALFALSREVADLVLMQAGATEMLDRLDVELRDRVILRKLDAPARDLHLQRRLLVEIEHVQREMACSEIDCGVERLAKRRAGLTRKPENQI